MTIRPKLYTAIYKGVEYTQCMKKWQGQINRSYTFLKKHLDVAKSKGIATDKAMQYAIEQKSDYGTKGSKPRKNPQAPESARKRKVDAEVHRAQSFLTTMAINTRIT